jgi:transposase
VPALFSAAAAGETLPHKARSWLDDLMALNQPLYEAYLLKADLRQLWHQPGADAAGLLLSAWIARAEATTRHHFVTRAATLKAHALQVLSWLTHPISTGPLEGLNNTIKVLKRQACGLRDLDDFKLRLYLSHNATPAFPA